MTENGSVKGSPIPAALSGILVTPCYELWLIIASEIAGTYLIIKTLIYFPA